MRLCNAPHRYCCTEQWLGLTATEEMCKYFFCISDVNRRVALLFLSHCLRLLGGDRAGSSLGVPIVLSAFFPKPCCKQAETQLEWKWKMQLQLNFCSQSLCRLYFWCPRWMSCSPVRPKQQRCGFILPLEYTCKFF